MIKEFLTWFIKPTPQSVEKRVLWLVHHTWDHVPFYREKMEKAGISPDDILSLQDYVDKFPRTSQKEYRAYQSSANSVGLIDTRLDWSELREDRSSGSSGVFLSLRRSRREIELNKGRSIWYLIRAGLRPWHHVLAVLHPARMDLHKSVLQRMGIFRRTTVSFAMPVEEIVQIIEREKINAMYGQKSYLRLIADYYYDRNLPGPKLHLLIPGAEQLSKADIGLFQEVFSPTRFREFYGSTETYFIAARHEGDFELDYKSVFFSLSNPEPNGELVKGIFVATSLLNEAQPILGLELGDRVSVRNYDRLFELGASIVAVEGRNNDYLVLPEGEKLSCTTLYVILDNFPFVRQFKIIQESVTECTVLLRVANSMPDSRKDMEQALMRPINGRIRCNFKYVDEIPLDKNGKASTLVSMIDQC